MRDHLPPHSVEAEQGVLGSLLLDRDAIAAVDDWLAPDAFFMAQNATIYRAMRALFAVRRPCDLLTIGELLRARGKLDEVGGAAYLAELTTAAPSAVHVGHYAEIVVCHAKRRALIDAAARLTADAHRADVELDDVLGRMRRAAEPFMPERGDVGGHGFDDGMDAHRSRVVDRWDGRLVETMTPTGIRPIDAKTHGGFRGGELVYVGGRPGSGKTALALQMAQAAARSGRAALFVSLEMGREALFNRAVAAEAGVPFNVAYAPVGDAMQREAWLSASDRLSALPLTIETDLTTTDKIRAFCERRLDDPIGCVFVDHLDYLNDPDLARMPTEQRTAALSRRLRGLANALGVPVVVLAQLNRAVEEHAPFRPALHHFKHSGGIEQDADFAFLLWRRMYYVEKGMLEGDMAQDYVTASSRHRVELMLAKHRNGEVGVVNLGWEPAAMRFTEAVAA